MRQFCQLIGAVALAASGAAYADQVMAPASSSAGAVQPQGKGATAATNAAAIAAFRADMDSQLGEILAALKISAAPPPPACPSGGPLSTVTVGPGQTFTEMAYAIPCMAPGFSMTVLSGTADVVTFDIPVGLDGWSIVGQADGLETLNGQGGCGPAEAAGGCVGGHRLAWGKGCIHAQSPGRVYGIVLMNCGGADGVGDGEAGLYGENFAAPATLVADHVMFRGNENGAFVPIGTAGVNVALDIESCDFVDNGQSKDGASHDLYINGGQGQAAPGFVGLIVNNSNFYGNPYGNQIKARAPVVHVSGGYNANTAGGRWIDDPNGGSVTVTGGVYDVPASTPGENIVGYGEEGASNGLTGFSVSGASIYIGHYNSDLQVASGGTVGFATTNTVTWTGSAASVGVSDGGSMTGLPPAPPLGTLIGSDPTPPAHISGAP